MAPAQQPGTGIGPGNSSGEALRRVCIRCGYDLTGLSSSGVCPECGHPISHSLRDPLLRYADQSYLSRLWRGALWAEIGLWSTLPVMLFLVVRGQVLSGLIPLGLWFVGWWLLSTPDSFSDRPFLRLSMHLRVALGLCGVLVGFLVATQLGPLAGLRWMVNGGWNHDANLAAAALGLMLLVAYALAMRLLAAIASRIPDSRLSERAAQLAWAMPLLSLVGCYVVIGPLIALVLSIQTLRELRTRLNQVRREAGTRP